MAARPQRGDTEDDLLAFQAQFIASKNKPAATVARATKSQDECGAGEKRTESALQRDVVDLHGLPQTLPTLAPPKKKSKFKEKRISREKAKLDDTEEDAAECLEKHDRHITTVLSEIRERDIRGSPVLSPATAMHKGFPMVLHRGNIKKGQKENSHNNQGKKSLFAQHFKVSDPTSFGLPTNTSKTYLLSRNRVETDIPDTEIPELQANSSVTSTLVSGEGLMDVELKDHSTAAMEAERIHTENLDKLATLTKQEILQEQERLKKSLDPSLLSFLQLRHQKNAFQGVNTEQDSMDIDSPLSSKKNEDESMDIEKDNNQSSTCNLEKHVHFEHNVSVISQDGVVEKVAEVEEFARMAESQKWIHMDKIELEKCEWMKNCPTPSVVKKEGGLQARFAFDGNLIIKDTTIPVNLGLHHHGDNPDAAGYTLEELFMLSRSSFLQQRVFALQTLTRVISQETKGKFHDVLQESVLQILLDAGLMFLLRWALDDTADAVMAVAAQCLAAALVVPSDQEFADQLFCWYRGIEWPSLIPKNEKEEKTSNSDEDDGTQDTDVELIKKDVIKGLLQMHILPRLRYIIEVCRPTSTTVRNILSVLTRIAKHSTEAAHEISKCPRLLESVCANFLPISWRKLDEPMIDVENVYGLPLENAMRLLRTICSCGRHLASIMVSRYDLIGRIIRYTTLHPRDVQLAYTDAMHLCIESIRTWTVCISYGLACDYFRENFSNFIQDFQKIQEISILQKVSKETSLECTRACTLIKLLEEAIHVAGTSAELHAKMVAASEERGEMEADSLPPPPINWSHVTGFLPLVTCALNKWAKQLANTQATDTHKGSGILIASALCNLLASFYSKLPLQPSYIPVDSLREIEDLVTTVVQPLSNSASILSLLAVLRENSAHTSTKVPVFLTRGIASLPDYGSLAYYCQPTTNMDPPTEPIPHEPAVTFMTSFTRLLCSLISVHKGIAKQFLSFVTREQITEYVRTISSRQEVLSQSVFGRFEHYLQYYMIRLFYLVVRSVDVKELATPLSSYHTAALVLLSRLRAGDEYYAHDLMSTVLFNPDFCPEANEGDATIVTKELSEMSIGSEWQSTPTQLLTSEPRRFTQKELLCQAHKNHLAIRSTYMGSFGKMRHALAVSRARALHQPHDIQSLLLPSSSGAFLPADWMFVPVVDLHNQSINEETKGRAVDQVPTSMVSTVTCTLQMILMLEEWRPVSLASVTMVSRVARLMCIFLTGSDLFLDSLVHNYVRSLLHIYICPSNFAQLDFDGSVAGLSSFYDLYTALLSQYSAVSFGDPLFASCLVLPLAQRHHIKFRHALWDEYVGTLRAVTLPVNQAPIPLEHFLYPIEQDDILLHLYLRALSNQDVRLRWCPFFYLVAVHHINAFIFQRCDPKDTVLLHRKLSLLNYVMQVNIQDVRQDLLYYYQPVPATGKPFELFTSLPPDRELFLRNRHDFQECKKLYETMASSCTLR